MEHSSRSDIIPTTEHGLPVDAQQAAAPLNLANFDQPMYRSICVDPAPQLPDTMQRYFSEPTTQVRDDLALEKVRYSKSRSDSLDYARKESKPLVLDTTLILERTRFTADGDYDTIRRRIVQFLQSQNVMFCDSIKSPSLHCSFYLDGTLVTFDVNIYRGESTFIIEFQRKSGCSMLFNRLYRRSYRAFTCADLPKEPMDTAQLVRALRSELSPASRWQGLQTLRRWLREDPGEASAAFTSLVRSGFLTGSDVVDLAMEICNISLLHALCSLSALACTDTQEVAQCWDQLKPRVLAVLDVGDAHIVAEACELCCRLQTNARNHVEIQDQRFVDNDILVAARARLAKDAAEAPFCLAAAVRSMLQAGEVKLNV